MFHKMMLSVAILPLVVMPANAQTMQQTGDMTTTWMSQVMHAQVDQRTWTVIPKFLDPTQLGAYDPDTNTSYLIKPYARLVYNKNLRNNAAARVLIHEAGHRSETVMCWGPQKKYGEINVEEGVVDAVAQDLAPVWMAKFGPMLYFDYVVQAAYPQDVSFVRAMSARATGSKNWRTKSARIWRYQLWAASCAGREAMLDRAS